ncbi:putative signaling protein [Methylophilaceae bacterium]|nr:putative signaling protein [Methylophilaceae bacterium]
MMEIQDDHVFLSDAFTFLIEAIPDSIILKDGNGRWLNTNEAAKVLFNLHEIDWQGKTDKELCLAYPRLFATYFKFLADGVAWDKAKKSLFSETVIDSAGNLRDYEISRQPLFNKSNLCEGLVVIGRDITERIQAERNLRVADTVIESLEAIIVTDANNCIVRVNQSFTRLTGYTQEEVIGKTPAILKSGRHDKTFYQAMWKTLSKNRLWQGEIWDRRKNGEIYPKWITISAVSGPDGEIHNYVGAFTDLSEHKEAREAIHRLAFYDPLTDMPNRRLLRDHLDLALANSARNLHYGAVLMIDLDNFKYVNDTKGHAVGDLLLIEVAQRIKSSLRQGDIVARQGGDEFVIMLESLSTDVNEAAAQVDAVCQKILRTINQPFLIQGYELHTSLSIGISMFTFPNATSEEMLKRADTAMYQAKSAGRNTMRFFDPDLYASLERRMSLESELRQALANDQLRLYYQPQVDHKNRIFGAEVLLRWEHPEDGMILPNDFIPLAEESGLILSIGYWVMRTTCMQLKIWESDPAAKDLTLAVNVSAKQFSQSNFVEHVCSVLEETGASAAMLKLELTETLVLKNVTDTIEKMNALRDIGIRFSVDDFGTGYSSLSYLKKLPISQLKIDRTFVREININQNDAVIAQTIIGMANNLGFNVIAEGVETEEQRYCLQCFGCLSYQGYLFSKPVPLEEFEKQIKTSKGAMHEPGWK